MHVIVSIKNVYGNETIYPVNTLAHQFAAIAGTKTLTRHTLNIIRGIVGVEIVVSQGANLAAACALNAEVV